MPLRLPEFGYRTTAPARGSTRRRTRPFSTSNASGRHEACQVSNTGQRHNPLPSQALRIFAPTICPARIPPEQVSQMNHAEPAGPARRAECPDLDGHGLGRHTAGARPERRIWSVRATGGPVTFRHKAGVSGSCSRRPPRTGPSGRNRHDDQHRVIVTVPQDFGQAPPMSGIQLARRSVFTISGRPAPREPPRGHRLPRRARPSGTATPRPAPVPHPSRSPGCALRSRPRPARHS